jgi:hypothetical protein
MAPIPVLSPLRAGYLTHIKEATDRFWDEERQDFPYLRLQSRTVFERLRGGLEQVVRFSSAPPLTELEWFLLLASSHLQEIGWQAPDAFLLPPQERYRLSGQMIRQRFNNPAGQNDLGLSLLRSQPLTIDALARICELTGQMISGAQLAQVGEPQAVGFQEAARLDYLAALLCLANLLPIERGSSRLRTLHRFGEHEKSDARLALEPYIGLVDLARDGLTFTYHIHPDDSVLAAKMSALFEEPIKSWWAANWFWLVRHHHFRLVFSESQRKIQGRDTPFAPLRRTCPALIAFLETYTPLDIPLPTVAELMQLEENQEQKENSGGLRMLTQDRYVDFDLSVDSIGKITARSFQGERFGNILLDKDGWEEIALAMELVERNSASENMLKNMGKALYSRLFPGDIHTHFSQTEAVARANGQKVRIRLSFEPQELARLPWEFLYQPDKNSFLAIDPDTVLSRYLNLPQPLTRVRRREGPLHLLLILSAPQDQPSLDLDDWQTTIEQALVRPVQAGQLSIQVVRSATLRNIQQALLEQAPDIVQFVGHGVYQHGKGYLALVNEQTQGTKRLDDEGFRDLFRGFIDHLGLICLAACESAKSDAPQGFQGIAPQLVQLGIPSVVAMQYSVLVSTASLFLESLYRSIAARKSVDWAVQEGRKAVRVEKGQSNREFATPVLSMRARDGQIF